MLVQWNPSIPYTLGTAQSVLIKGGVLISGVVLYTLRVAGTKYSVPIKGDVHISRMSLYRGFTIIVHVHVHVCVPCSFNIVLYRRFQLVSSTPLMAYLVQQPSLLTIQNTRYHHDYSIE